MYSVIVSSSLILVDAVLLVHACLPHDFVVDMGMVIGMIFRDREGTECSFVLEIFRLHLFVHVPRQLFCWCWCI